MKYKTTPKLFNEARDAAVEKYVSEFNSFGRKSAEAVIGMGKTVLAAKKNLVDNNEFRQFSNRIRFENSSSAIRKLIQIGKKADLLYKYLERLPSAWTTLYQLSQLTDEQLRDALDKQLVDHTSSGDKTKRVVAKLMGKPLSPKQPRLVSQSASPAPIKGYFLTIHFDDMPAPEAAFNLEQVVLKMLGARRIEAQVCRSPELDQLILDSENTLPLAA